MKPDGASMVFGPFAETKGPRLPGRNPAIPRKATMSGGAIKIRDKYNSCGEKKWALIGNSIFA